MNQEWVEQANCKNYPEVNFFPTLGESIKPAVLVCAECCVRAECLEFGLTQPNGIYGGVSERGRRIIRRQRRLADIQDITDGA